MIFIRVTMSIFRKSINRKLMLLFFIVGVASLSIIGIYSYYNAKEALLKRTLDQLTSIRVIKEGQLEFFFHERIRNLKMLSENEQINGLISDIYAQGDKKAKNKNQGNNPVIDNLKSNLLGFNKIYILDIINIDTISVYGFVNDQFEITAIDSTTYLQFLELSNCAFHHENPCIADFAKRFHNDTTPYAYLGKTIQFKAENRKLILALQIPISDINNIMLEQNPENGLGESGEIYLVGNDFLMRSNSRFIQNSVLNTKVNTLGARNAFTDKHGSAIIDDYRTVPCLSSFHRLNIPYLQWAIIAEIDYEEAMIPIVSIRNDIVFLSLIICVFLFSISHFISRTITNPIIRLKDAAQSVGQGDLDVKLHSKTKDEIGLLTLAFNTMILQLKEERMKRMTALYDGQELERQRISRELHDGLGQKLIAIKFQLESTSKQTADEIVGTIRDVKENFIRTIDEVRLISNNLAPNILKESTLDIAIRMLCNSIKKSTSFEIDFSTYGKFDITDTKMNVYIYRIAQEALNNAVKHSNAEKIDVQLIASRENIILVVEDNGIGFTVSNDYCTQCNGIYNMRERAYLINGTLDVETEPQMGTTVRLKILKKLTPSQILTNG